MTVEAFWSGFEKRAYVKILKGLASGLLGTADLGAEALARQAGKGVRRAVAPVGVAGGTAYAVSKKGDNDGRKKGHHRKA